MFHDSEPSSKSRLLFTIFSPVYLLDFGIVSDFVTVVRIMN